MRSLLAKLQHGKEMSMCLYSIKRHLEAENNVQIGHHTVMLTQAHRRIAMGPPRLMRRACVMGTLYYGRRFGATKRPQPACRSEAP